MATAPLPREALAQLASRPLPATDADLVRRAFAAYLRGGATQQPANYSDVEHVDTRRYVVLRNGGGVLAAYRVLNNGTLKGLRRWPSELDRL